MTADVYSHVLGDITLDPDKRLLKHQLEWERAAPMLVYGVASDLVDEP